MNTYIRIGRDAVVRSDTIISAHIFDDESDLGYCGVVSCEERDWDIDEQDREILAELIEELLRS